MTEAEKDETNEDFARHKYLAELWWQSLLADLCWFHATNPGTYPVEFGIDHRVPEYRAPSRSWASIDVAQDAYCCWWSNERASQFLMLLAHEPRPICSISEAVCHPSTADSTGAVKGGLIKISGLLITVNIHVDPTPKLPWTISNVQDDTNVKYCIPDCEPDDDGLKDGDEVYCMPIQEHLWEDRSESGCLILKKAERSQSNTCRRIGFGVLVKENPDLDETQKRALRWNRSPWAQKIKTDRKHAFRLDGSKESQIIIV